MNRRMDRWVGETPPDAVTIQPPGQVRSGRTGFDPIRPIEEGGVLDARSQALDAGRQISGSGHPPNDHVSCLESAVVSPRLDSCDRIARPG